MKLSNHVGNLALLAFLSHQTADAFAPSSSFTSFSSNAIVGPNGAGKNQNMLASSIRSNRHGVRKGRSEMNMMFDQLSSAISEVAKNIGGRKRYVFY